LIYDEPLLRWPLKDATPGIEILLQIIERQDYAFGLKPGFAQRQALNPALLAQIRGTEWQETLNRYLGQR
jgi:polar amino acid transport system substrate-binding protein